METTSAISHFQSTSSNSSFMPNSSKWLISNPIKQDFNNKLAGQVQIPPL